MDQRHRLGQGHLALRAEAVDDGGVERTPKPVAVAEARHHGGHQGGSRVLLGKPLLDRRCKRRVGGGAVPDHGVPELELQPVGRLAEHGPCALERLVGAHPRWHPAVDQDLGARGDHVLLL